MSAHADTLSTTTATTSKITLQEEARSISEVYNLDTQIFLATISCESGWNIKARGDNGDSRGLVQISHYWNPTVTDKEADDPKFALHFMAKLWSQGKQYYWSCYKIVTARRRQSTEDIALPLGRNTVLPNP